MDTLTHGLFGLTIYGAQNKEKMTQNEKRALLFTALVASEIPDIDVVASFTETGRIMEQMWHRGLTHSIFLVPVWALFIYGMSRWFFRAKAWRIFWTALLSVLIHITSDAFNSWGTGLLEPFSSVRFTAGTIPIIDFVIWALFLAGLIWSKFFRHQPAHRIFKIVALCMFLHFFVQSAQGLWLQHQLKPAYDRVELSASFVPWHFDLIGKKDNKVEISSVSLWSEPKPKKTLVSSEESDLTPLFAKNPKAKVLYEWSPFVVIVDNSRQLGIYDPRFYRNGESFLAEYIHK
ncbi:MAG: metal-dependent hydrolase [Thermoactinomyces sp.]